MDNSVFLSRLTQTRSPNPEGNVFDGIWSEYEKNVRSLYDKHLHKMQRTVEKKTDWPTYSEKEKQTIKNTVLLTEVLYKMCRIEVVVKAEQPNVVETVNQIALEAIQEEATTILLVIKENAV